MNERIDWLRMVLLRFDGRLGAYPAFGAVFGVSILHNVCIRVVSGNNTALIVWLLLWLPTFTYITLAISRKRFRDAGRPGAMVLPVVTHVFTFAMVLGGPSPLIVNGAMLVTFLWWGALLFLPTVD